MGTNSYADFLASKRVKSDTVGHHVELDALHSNLHDWQARIVQWAVRKGRCALWESTGSGKSRQMIEWTRHSAGKDGRALIVAPLAVCHQTIREARELDMDIRYAPDGDAITGPGTWITNYERADRMPPGHELDAVVLDEGQVLRDATGKTTTLLTNHFAATPRKLTATATPAPNEADELCNQAAFLGVMSRADMRASFFIHEGNSWRPKGHALGPMSDWMATWAVALRKPSDLGSQYSDKGYDLPGLDVVPEVVDVAVQADGQLFATELGGVSSRARIRRETMPARVARTVELVEREPDEQWLLWCELNDEADALARALPDAVNVHGGMTPEEKAEALLAFADGKIKVLITKPKIAGRGMNFQRCARMAFCGIGDSFEDMYQCIRRCFRYGQLRVVRAHVVVSELEHQRVANIARKQREHELRIARLVASMQRNKDWILAA